MVIAATKTNSCLQISGTKSPFIYSTSNHQPQQCWIIYKQPHQSSSRTYSFTSRVCYVKNFKICEMAFNRCTFHYNSHKFNTLNSFARNVNVNAVGFSKKTTCQFVIVAAAAVGRSHTMSLPLVYVFIIPCGLFCR